MLQAKFGIFKSKAYDNDNSLNWTMYGEGYVGHNKMDRKFLVIDKIYNAKSDYLTYGVAFKNQLSKEFILTEHIGIKPYGSLKFEYGRFETIKEKMEK